MSIYVGGVGKDNSWVLISECPLVVFDGQEKQFIGVAGLENVLSYYESEARYRIYAWRDGIWTKVSFVAPANTPARSMGFSPD